MPSKVQILVHPAERSSKHFGLNAIYDNTMQVREVMHENPLVLHDTMSCADAVRVFVEHKVSGAPIVNASGVLRGLVSEKDLFRAMFPEYREFYQTPESGLDYDALEAGAQSIAGRPITSIMHTRVLTARPDEPIVKIGAQMVATGMHHVPVVEAGKVIGMVGRGDIYRAILARYFDTKKK